MANGKTPTWVKPVALAAGTILTALFTGGLSGYAMNAEIIAKLAGLTAKVDAQGARLDRLETRFDSRSNHPRHP